MSVHLSPMVYFSQEESILLTDLEKNSTSSASSMAARDRPLTKIVDAFRELAESLNSANPRLRSASLLVPAASSPLSSVSWGLLSSSPR